MKNTASVVRQVMRETMLTPDKKLGEKIRELRKQRGITQKDLAGDKITRNMLSLIESGNASPSVSTLLYIAEQLDTPAGYFFTTTAEDEGKFMKMSVIGALKEQFRQKKFRECERLCLEIPAPAMDDELAHILAVSYLSTATDHAYTLEFRAAFADLDKAEKYGALSIYCGAGFTRALLFYRDLFRSAASDTLPDTLLDLTVCSEYVPFALVQYFLALKLVKAGDNFPASFPRGSHAERHIHALLYLREERLNDGVKRLRELSLDPALPYYMQYRVLVDLEEAANLAGDVRLAYSSSRRRLELIEKFRFA